MAGVRYNKYVVMEYFREMGLPDCVTEYQFHPDRKWRVDFAWLEQRVALEVEGLGGRHQRMGGFIKDIEKYNELVLMRWRPLKVIPKDLCMSTTIDMLRRALWTETT